MNERIEYKGYWFIPNNSDNAIAGVLTFTPQKSMILELIGEFDSGKTPIETFFDRTHFPIIHGISSDAKQISLINCHPSGGKLNPSCSFPISRYSAQYILVGKHIQNFDNKIFNWAKIVIPSLTNWCLPKVLKQEFSLDNEDKTRDINISFNIEEIKSPISSVYINQTTTLNIKASVDFDGSTFLLTPRAFPVSSVVMIGNK